MSQLLKVGFLVNPIAGVGAELAWKGSDNIDEAWDAVKSGARQPVFDILKRLELSKLNLKLFVTSLTPTFGEIVYDFPKQSSRYDTIRTVQKFKNLGVDLILFIGGDGTARDIAEVSGDTPILGIPGGVKIFSGVFLHKPEDIHSALQKWNGETTEMEVVDLDEEAYRQGRAEPRIFALVKVPVIDSLQKSKEGGGGISDKRVLEMLAERISDSNWLDALVIVGPGSTTHSIFQFLGLPKTLLGVDVYENGQCIISDATTQDLLNIEPNEIWITPIGRQGHIFGRGNRQINAQIIRRVGRKHIRIFSTPEKIQNLSELYVDTGDPELDHELQGYIKVYISYSDSVVRKVI